MLNYQRLFKESIWIEATPEQKVVLVVLVNIVNHMPRRWQWKGQPYLCRPGQAITSVKGIQKRCGKGITRQNVRTALKRFTKLGFIFVRSSKQGLLVTIDNHWFNQESNQVEDELKPNEQNTSVTRFDNLNNKLTNLLTIGNHQAKRDL